ncbi:hypothetical protein DLAC_09913 [Tieghemostelium lacteum]|uniref:MYND-type domain-containing protein n=1 Tax=Tieghemostelium lacteum TaxID=361077 RepID=A0A151Z5N3_TIELA|nr:hypothetical protein DLAC_09913 [Tieghemostelium lacteum]|eukprot:KYQ89255.1 hypothetical protein DLAC_09913 [Tieghemostelium lacteum]
MPPIIDNLNSLSTKDYIQSIQCSGLPRVDYIMEKCRRDSSVDYIIENDPKPVHKNITTKPRSRTLPNCLKCYNCKKHYPLDDLKPCDRCGNGVYCSDDCQFDHWKSHKKQCRDLGMIIKMKRDNY